MTFPVWPSTSMLIALRSAIACQAGLSAISFAAAAPALITAVGLASDISIATMKKAELQSLADQAAIASANELALGITSQTVLLATASSFVDASASGTERAIQKSAELGEQNSSVTVTLTENWTPMFAHFVGFDVTPIRVDATASLAGQSNICMLALDTSGNGAISTTKAAYIKAPNCAVYSNSSSSESIIVSDQSRIEANSICSAGGFNFKGKATPPSVMSDCPVVADPLEKRQKPSFGSCDFKNVVIAKGTASVSPGVYCGGLTIKGDAKVTINPGTYIMDDGPFSVVGDAIVSGEDVAFFMTGAHSTIKFDNNATVSLSGAETGDLAGLLFFEDASSNIGRRHIIRATHVENLTGTIYLPSGELLVDPNSSVGADSAYTAIVAYRIAVDNGPSLVLNTDYQATNVPVPSGIKSAAQVVLTY
jgi:Flp pilus assembly protein TadG